MADEFAAASQTVPGATRTGRGGTNEASQFGCDVLGSIH